MELVGEKEWGVLLLLLVPTGEEEEECANMCSWLNDLICLGSEVPSVASLFEQVDRRPITNGANGSFLFAPAAAQ